jgi:hypothetical protein
VTADNDVGIVEEFVAANFEADFEVIDEDLTGAAAQAGAEGGGRRRYSVR